MTQVAATIRKIAKAHGIKGRARTEGRNVDVALQGEASVMIAIITDLKAAGIVVAHVTDDAAMKMASIGAIKWIFKAAA